MANMIQRKVIVEPAEGGAGWLVMFESGVVIWRRTAERVVQEMRKRDREMVRRVTGVDGCVTTIEWRNVPEGFVPPKEA